MGCRPSSPEPHPDTESDRNTPSDPSNEPATVKQRNYRPSIASLQIPKELDDISSDGMSERSGENEAEENMDYLCHTDVTLQWLLQRMSDKFGKDVEEEPQWITERLNRPNFNDYATSLVIRVTFGWENEDLPKSAILKLPIPRENRDDEDGKYHYLLFKRECNVYEWTQHFPKIPAPKIFHIKHRKEGGGGSGVVVMEDVGERGTQQEAVRGLSVEVVSDLLKHLALIHSTSMKHSSWSTLIADLPPSYYSYIIGDFDKTMDFFENNDIEHSRFVYTAKYFTTEYLHSTATESSDELSVPRVLVQGEPYAPNVFTDLKEEDKVTALIDWTECHSGCFAEDLAKAICWNLSTKDRLECTASLLEVYHYHLNEFGTGDVQITLEAVRKAYERFLPFAMVTLVGKVMQVRQEDDIETLVERAKGLIQNVYATQRMMQDG